jgi:hypothetical protein
MTSKGTLSSLALSVCEAEIGTGILGGNGWDEREFGVESDVGSRYINDTDHRISRIVRELERHDERRSFLCSGHSQSWMLDSAMLTHVLVH